MEELQKSRINSGRDEQYNNYEVILQAASEGKEKSHFYNDKWYLYFRSSQ